MARFGSTALAGLAIVAALDAQTAFPAPTGKYAVGTKLYHWVDASRDESLTPESGDKRELMVQLWYPIAKGAKGELTRYLPHFDELRVVLSSDFRAHERKFKRARVPAIVDAAPLGGRALPVLVFTHGLGTSRLFYTGQILELASHGYCVAALDHTYDVEGVVCPGPMLVQRIDAETSEQEKQGAASATTPATDRLRVWAADLSFVVDKLAELNKPKPATPFSRRLDLRKLGLIGHCYGSQAALLAASRDRRFRALVTENGWPPATEVATAGLSQPLLFLWGQQTKEREFLEKHGAKPADVAKLVAQFRNIQLGILKKLHTRIYHVEVLHQKHMDFTDLPMVARWVDRGTADDPNGFDAVMQRPARLDIVNHYTVAFFDTFLRRRRAKLWKLPAAKHEGVEYRVLEPAKRARRRGNH